MKSKILSSLLPFLLMSEGMGMDLGDNTYGSKSDLRPEDIDVRPATAPIPKGCKEYWFNMEGRFTNGDGTNKMLKDETVFYCIATTDKSAKAKFNKWKLTIPENEK